MRNVVIPNQFSFMEVDKIFDEIASKMNSDLERARSSLNHPGLKGDAFEEIFREFLKDYLPDKLDVSTGTVVDSNGGQSKQLDVIISDKLNTPIFYRSNQNRVIPAECLYSVIEVKANLDSNELEKCFENMKSVKSLSKKAYIAGNGIIQERIVAYDQKWEIWATNYFVFAYNSINLYNLATKLADLNSTMPVHSRIDSICVLNKGVITNKHTNGHYDALPTKDSGYFVCETKKALLLFYGLISKYIFQVQLPKFRFIDYINTMGFGEED